MVDKNINAKANESAKKAVEMLSDSAIYAICVVAKNMKNGAFWGFTDMEGAKKHVDAIRNDPNIRVKRLGDSVVVEVNPNYLVQNIRSVEPNIFSKEDMDKMQLNMASAVVEFEKFLINKGISKPNFGATIGIYSTNNVTNIAVKGVSFPAFRLNIEKAMHILATYGYQVKVGGSFMPAAEAMKSPNLWDSIKLSPTKTGAFINIRSTASPEQLKAMKKKFDNNKTF